MANDLFQVSSRQSRMNVGAVLIKRLEDLSVAVLGTYLGNQLK